MKFDVLIFAHDPRRDKPVLIRSGIIDAADIRADITAAEYDTLIRGEPVRVERIVLGIRITGRMVPLLARSRDAMQEAKS